MSQLDKALVKAVETLDKYEQWLEQGDPVRQILDLAFCAGYVAGYARAVDSFEEA